jgi:hypothetical protein
MQQMKKDQTRKSIKRGHEDYVIAQFVAWYNQRHRGNFDIVEKPDPPDAIIRSGRRTRWIEHCDIYRNKEEAREEYSAIVPGEKYMPHSEHPLLNPDDRTAQSLWAAIQMKISKSSYEVFRNLYGKGILVTNERDPLFDNSTVTAIRRRLRCDPICLNTSHFKSVYLGYRIANGLSFIKILPNN